MTEPTAYVVFFNIYHSCLILNSNSNKCIVSDHSLIKNLTNATIIIRLRSIFSTLALDDCFCFTTSFVALTHSHTRTLTSRLSSWPRAHSAPNECHYVLLQDDRRQLRKTRALFRMDDSCRWDRLQDHSPSWFGKVIKTGRRLVYGR